ncbi:gas vesicle protein [Streptomyces avermitilis]|uniref:Gas vesicle synthesis protein n=3 Tax=Streptomyces avermitilis TaxID=33903 RepID=Q82QB1_STRAW|nr:MULTISPECIES: gas vesicle protein [Streptomyces]KUN50720.1 gas vesicle protein [Streptomyces avermitilis]MYS96266.1 gas vesicle protein [Streptomyces sp. SID5469]BAC68309.1 putative gas vesicle synthesis protein [Streptomyces avermitilis MA-4680 = NBRC 14893]
MPADRNGDSARPRKRTHRGTEESRVRSRGESPRPSQRLSASRAMLSAMQQLKELLGKAPESVSAVRPTDDGWEAEVEVLEIERIPETTSVMASYRVTLDADGELMAYERIRRYTRAQVDRRA